MKEAKKDERIFKEARKRHEKATDSIEQKSEQNFEEEQRQMRKTMKAQLSSVKK